MGRMSDQVEDETWASPVPLASRTDYRRTHRIGESTQRAHTPASPSRPTGGSGSPDTSRTALDRVDQLDLVVLRGRLAGKVTGRRGEQWRGGL